MNGIKDVLQRWLLVLVQLLIILSELIDKSDVWR